MKSKSDGEKPVSLTIHTNEIGLVHRVDGPAMINHETGTSDYFYEGECITNEVEEWLKERNFDSDNLSEEDQLALSFYMMTLVK